MQDIPLQEAITINSAAMLAVDSTVEKARAWFVELQESAQAGDPQPPQYVHIAPMIREMLTQIAERVDAVREKCPGITFLPLGEDAAALAIFDQKARAGEITHPDQVRDFASAITASPPDTEGMSPRRAILYRGLDAVVKQGVSSLCEAAISPLETRKAAKDQPARRVRMR